MVDNFQVKRRKIIITDPMETQAALAKLAAVKEKLGRDIRVFETSTSAVSQPESSTGSVPEESDDFYEFTAEDYYRISATKKEDKYLKTRKIREAEEAVRRSRITKTVIRVRFPDNCTLEATFHPSETFQSLVDLLVKVLDRPEVPFFIYTTPPKKQIKDMSQDFFSAGFIPGAIVYFSYDQPKDDVDAPANSVPYLRGEIMSLKGLNPIMEPVKSVEPPVEHVMAAPPPVMQEHRPVQKKPVKPKWLRM